MPLLAHDALKLARTNIEAAQEARGAKNKVIKHYRIAKNVLAKVDAVKADTSSLKEVVAAFQDLAEVLDNSGVQVQEKAAKCRQRADTLKLELDRRIKINDAVIAPALIVPGFPLAIAQSIIGFMNASTGVSSPSGSITSPVSSINASTTTFIKAPLLFFIKDVSPAPYICQLPDPGEQLHTTSQLAYCLALLQDSTVEDDLSPDSLKWRYSTLKNSDEKGRLETLAVQIIGTFVGNTMKDAAAVDEVVQLAPVLSIDHFQALLKALIDTVDHSEFLNLHLVEGLAKVIQDAIQGSLNSDHLVTILRVLHKRLRAIHSQSVSHRYHLVLAVSQALDAMADAYIGDVDRVNLHGPLMDLLRESDSSEDPYLTFQAAYAAQALLNVSDDDNIWHAGLRRGWLVVKGGAGFAKMPDPSEIKDALEGLERLYEAGKGGARMLKDALEAIKTNEKPTFTVKEGLKFKRAWYRALRTAESYIQTGKLVRFKDLVTTTPCRHQLMFQWGICQLLGHFAADTQWELEARQSTIAFLEALYRGDSIWDRHKDVDQVIFDVLANMVSNHGTQFEAAKILLEEMEKQNSALKKIGNPHSHSWNNILHVTPNVSLLDTVQNRIQRNINVDNLPKQHLETMQAIRSSGLEVKAAVDQLKADTGVITMSLEDIRSALEKYYARYLSILRVSGEELELETCFVNLAIVEAPTQREKEKHDLKEQAAVFHRIPSFEKVERANMQSSIPSEQLFNKRKLRDGKENIPKRILVQGRAGIGKTTLCKKLVHTYQTGQWRDRFDSVLWFPLRQLRGFKSRNLQGLFREKFFAQGCLHEEAKALARALEISAQQGRVLFVLDGLDEIVLDTECDDGIALRSFLETLLTQQHVVITSRPSGLDRSLLPSIDLELETVGFSQQNVSEFLAKVLEPEAVREVQDFIRQTPLIQGIVNIPVQLDVLCFSWGSLSRDGQAKTVTGLYQMMVQKLWRKDALLLKKAANGRVLTEKQISKLYREEIEELMATESQYLGYLAFKGLKDKHQIEFDEIALLSAFIDLNYHATFKNGLLSSQFLEVMKQTSFLHTADADLDSSNSDSQQAWHFLHLTFQEYFAATWIARHLQVKQPHLPARMMTEDQLIAFVQEHKYNPQYEIVWWMVAGLLQGEALEEFFGLLQGAPRDLIGGRHQQILASCLNEARARLDSTVVTTLETELMKWLHFETQTCHGGIDVSKLGSQNSFPETLLVENLDSASSQKAILVGTLGARSTLSESAIQSLKDALKDGDKDVRKSAASALGKQSTLSESTIQSLIDAFKDEDKGVRRAAASALGNQSTLSEPAIQSLIDALKDEDEDVRWSVESALGKQSTLSESAIQSLIDVLKDEDNYVKMSAASALGNQSTLSESAIQSLIDALKDENWDVRMSAVSALDKQSTLPESAIQSLVDALKDGDNYVRMSAESALGNQSTLSESTIQSLIAVLKDEDEDVKESAVSVLGNQSTLSESTIQSLIDAFKDEDKGVRRAAASALGNQSTLSESAIQSIIDALKDEDWDVRMSAASALGNQSTLSELAIPSLIDALKDEDKGVRWSAASALGKQSTLSESAIKSLIDALKDEDKDVRKLAASALGKQSTLSESAIQSLIDALKDENWNFRMSAALGKQSILSESTIQSLIDALKDEDWNVRRSAVSALGNQSTLSKLAIQSLIDTLNDIAGMSYLYKYKTTNSAGTRSMA
ncbi:hypothetical protein BGZ51_005818 [Haplosporangium sp. Z 767]|nr:hypothetical protein BGZ51_005818 [Haplosporangium sp. Z 767]